MTRRFRPAVDRMEGRELLSVTPDPRPPESGPAPQAARRRRRRQRGRRPGASRGPERHDAGPGRPEPVPRSRPARPPPTRPAGRRSSSPSRARSARGRARYSDETSLIHINGAGRSTYFLHGDIQLGAVVPTDLSRPTSGVATSFDKNINTNSVFGFDLYGSTADLDAAGRPTHFTAATDVNISSGTFVEAQSTATVDIKYFPDGKAHPEGNQRRQGDGRHPGLRLHPRHGQYPRRAAAAGTAATRRARSAFDRGGSVPST